MNLVGVRRTKLLFHHPLVSVSTLIPLHVATAFTAAFHECIVRFTMFKMFFLDVAKRVKNVSDVQKKIRRTATSVNKIVLERVSHSN